MILVVCQVQIKDLDRLTYDVCKDANLHCDQLVVSHCIKCSGTYVSDMVGLPLQGDELGRANNRHDVGCMAVSPTHPPRCSPGDPGAVLPAAISS